MNKENGNEAVREVPRFDWLTFDDLHGRFKRHTEALGDALQCWGDDGIPESTIEVILSSFESAVKEMGQIIENERTKKPDHSLDNDEFLTILAHNGSEMSKLAESAAEKIDLLSTEVLNAYLRKCGIKRRG